MLSPKTKRTFDANLERLDCPVLLCYGASDPWVVPLWGQRFKRAVPHAAYYELAPVGHCPHHEAPNAVNALVADWVAAAEARLQRLMGGGAGEGSGGEGDGSGSGGGGADPLLVDGPLRVGESRRHTERSGAEVVVAHVTGAPRNVFERADAAAHAAGRRVRELLGMGKK